MLNIGWFVYLHYHVNRISCDPFQLQRVFQRSTNHLLWVEVDPLVGLLLEHDPVLLKQPVYLNLLQTLMVAIHETAQQLSWFKLEDIQSLLQWYLGVGLLSTFRDLDSHRFQDSVKERAKVVWKRVLLLKREDFSIVTLFYCVTQQQYILNVWVLELFDSDRFQLGVELLIFIGGEKEKQMYSSDHRVELRLVRNQRVFVEKLHVVNSILDSLVAPRSKSMKEIQLWEPHWIERLVPACFRYSSDWF